MFKRVNKSWFNVIDKDMVNTIKKKVFNTVKNDVTLLSPSPMDWFKWAQIITNPLHIKVVIISQTPYSSRTDADGMCYSSRKNISPALNNIYQSMIHNKVADDTIYKSNDLTYLAEQGVLLYNFSLSTIEGEKNSHFEYWQCFSEKFIYNLSVHGKINNVKYIFLLWGSFASKLTPYIGNYHTILKSIHPEKESQNNTFITCGHYKKVNELLYENPIIWNREDYNNIKNTNNVFKINKLLPITCHTKGAENKLKNELIFFTDGSCVNNGKYNARGSYGFLFINTSKYYCGYLPTTNFTDSNIRAEGYAIYSVLCYIKKRKNWQVCNIITDSEFWINMINIYIPNWFDKNIDITTKKNHDLVKSIWEILTKLRNKDKTIYFTHVPSHNKKNWKYSEELYKVFCNNNNEIIDNIVSTLTLDKK